MRGHASRVHDMQAVGDSIISVSGDRMRRHSIGGLSKATFMPDQVLIQLECMGLPFASAQSPAPAVHVSSCWC